MSNKIVSRLLIILGVLLGLSAVIGGGFFILKSQGLIGGKSVATSLPRPPSTMTVSLTNPVGVTHLNAGGKLAIHGQMMSNYPVDSLELWVNGKMVEKRTPPLETQKTFFLALWNWQSSEAGIFKMNLRGLDRDGRSTYSNMVSVVVEGAIDQATGQQVLPILDLAQLPPVFSETPDAPFTNPTGGNAPAPSGGGSETGGEENAAPTPNENAPTPDPNPTPDENAPTPDLNPTPDEENKDSTLGEPPKNLSFNLKVNITNPETCVADLEIEDLNRNATSFLIERSAPQDLVYYPITTINAGAGSSHYIDNSPKEKGSYLYIVTAFNNTGSQVSETNEVIYDDDCANESWNGVIFADFKVIPKEPADNLHCYYWLDSILWQRLPHPDGSSIPPMTAEELDIWNTNLGSLMGSPGPYIQLASPVGYDLTPFAPDLSQTGFSKFRFNLICHDRDEDKVTNLGLAQGELDLELPDKMTKMSADTGLFDVYIYLGTKVMLGSQPSTTVAIANPYDVQASMNPDICPVELKSWCKDFVQLNYVILRWRWNPEPCYYGESDSPENIVCVKDPSSFNLYRYTYVPQYTQTQSYIPVTPASDGYIYTSLSFPIENYESSPSDTYDERVKKDMLKLKEYCVRAESNNLESADFQESCVRLTDLDIPSKLKTKTFNPLDGPGEMGVYSNGQDNDYSTSSAHDFGNDSLPGHLYTGLGIDGGGDDDVGLLGMDWWNAYGFFKYDLEPLMGKKIHSAYLTLGNEISASAKINSGGNVTYPAFESVCSRGLMVSNRHGSPGWHNADPPDATVTHNYINQKMNVTDEVRMWTEGSMTNHGFMFGIWPSVTIENFDSWGCEVDYGPMQLVVEYYE